MKNPKIFFFAISMILFNACNTDEFNEELGTNPIPSEMTTSIMGSLNGLVVDENQEPISGVSIELNGITISTDENGFF